MPRGALRSRTFRRVYVRTPGARNVLHYRQRKNSPAICAVTGERLHGVKRLTDAQIRNTPKTQRRPQRPFGGVLGSKAMRAFLRQKARELSI